MWNCGTDAGSMRSGCKKLRYLPTRGRVVGVGRAEAVRRHREALQAARPPAAAAHGREEDRGKLLGFRRVWFLTSGVTGGTIKL